jgi:hypothetical protein
MNDLDPSHAGSVEDLARCLRRLHVRADRPSFRALEDGTRHANGLLPGTRIKRVPLRRSTLSEVLQGQLFPRKAILLTFVEACGIDLETDRRWEQTWDRLAEERDQTRETAAEQLQHQVEELRQQAVVAGQPAVAAEAQAEAARAEAEKATAVLHDSEAKPQPSPQDAQTARNTRMRTEDSDLQRQLDESPVLHKQVAGRLRTSLRVLVLSDLHCTSIPPGDAAGSWLTTRTPISPRGHPLRAVDSVLHDAGVTVDVILCAGDLCDKADPAALQYVWHELTNLADRLEARLIATVGNSDLDSRHAVDADPKGALFDLRPAFPCLDDTLRDKYWSRDYALVEGKGWRIVTLNSCTFHGYNLTDGPELEIGKVSRSACRHLQAELNELGPTTATQILLVHHHLEQLPNVDQQDSSQMKDAQDLIKILTRTGPWMVIHGHKHRARLLYAHGSGGSPMIMSAGSFSAYPYGGLTAEENRNQFYVITFPSRSDLDQLGMGLAGTFQAWDWIPSQGWVPAAARSGLPANGGFGWRGDPSVLARRLEAEVRASGAIDHHRLMRLESRLQYMIPSDLNILAHLLETKGIPVQRRDNGEFLSVGWPLVPHW